MRAIHRGGGSQVCPHTRTHIHTHTHTLSLSLSLSTGISSTPYALNATLALLRLLLSLARPPLPSSPVPGIFKGQSERENERDHGVDSRNGDADRGGGEADERRGPRRDAVARPPQNLHGRLARRRNPGKRSVCPPVCVCVSVCVCWEGGREEEGVRERG